MRRLAGIPFILLLVALASWAIYREHPGSHTPHVAAAVDNASPTITPAVQTVTPTPPITLVTTNTPPPAVTQEPTATPTPLPVPTSPYTVLPGDTLAGIATRLSIPADDRDAWIIDLLSVNSLTDANHVEAGQTLVLPSLDEALAAVKTEVEAAMATPSPTETPDANDTPDADDASASSASSNAESASTPDAASEPTATATPDDGVRRLEPESVNTTYVVQPGDTLSSIADTLGVSASSRDAWMAKVLQINNIDDVDHVQAGETLTLPDVSSTSESSTSTKESVKPTLARYTAPDATALSGTAAPSITGTSAAVLDGDCGSLVYGFHAHQRLAPASLTKIITAIVTMQHAGLTDDVTAAVSASEMAQKDYSVMGLEPGMTVSVKDLLYGLLLPSGNDAAQTLAAYAGGSVSGFVSLMNQEAAQIGLSDTHFSNPSGLDDPDLYSSAYDMAEAGLVLLANPTLARIVDTISYMPDSPDWTNGALTNDNQMLATYPGAYGLKIGYDDNAGQTIVAAAVQDGRHLVVSVFGSQNRYADATSLLDWAFANLPATCAG